MLLAAIVFLFLVLPALGLVALVAAAHLVAWLGRSVRRAPAPLGRWARGLTVEPTRGAAFNDSRDVWPMPSDD
ncbi:hypothetical protein OG777_20015 [Micromonospora peucetia]|uniref:Uncharacterized protein n=1 Tax=Micromonospora peucetia TaxID=47871 RepID=A0A1C6V520_9ACTN|nr:hypothetical protein [Micromonospora peucetia]MCX4389198.1 hypothetical protein [Micromonospora peucetia]WSA35391.1 hypothetical protein OIE14_15765 [Micromonospora peucetia]SCL61459.1 hypothetical protein GA0070608_2476 [Micromonospora peucetia]